MKEQIEFTATRYLGHHTDVSLKSLRRELTRMAKVAPAHAQITIEPISGREGQPAYYRQLVARWSNFV